MAYNSDNICFAHEFAIWTRLGGDSLSLLHLVSLGMLEGRGPESLANLPPISKAGISVTTGTSAVAVARTSTLGLPAAGLPHSMVFGFQG